MWTPLNTLLIEELALTEEKGKIEENTTTGILTTVTGVLLYDDLRQGQQLSYLLLSSFLTTLVSFGSVCFYCQHLVPSPIPAKCELRDVIYSLRLSSLTEHTNQLRFTYAPHTLSRPRLKVLARDMNFPLLLINNHTR